jgi:hypothetical protein
VVEEKKDKSESTNMDLEEIQLDHMTAAVPRSNRIISRLSHLKNKEGKPKEESVELKVELDNLPAVDRRDRNRLTAQIQRRKGNSILSKESK